MRKSLASRPLIYNTKTKTKKDKQGIKTQKNERERAIICSSLS